MWGLLNSLVGSSKKEKDGQEGTSLGMFSPSRDFSYESPPARQAQVYLEHPPLIEDYVRPERQNGPGKAFFENLLSCEEQLHNNKYTMHTLSDLVSFYGRLVEHYDDRADPISDYFMEKIQNTLTLQSSLQLLYQDKEEHEEEPSPYCQNYLMRDQKRRRASKVKVFIEYQDQHRTANYQQSMAEIMSCHDLVCKRNHHVVTADLDSQLNDFNDRLQKRKRQKRDLLIRQEQERQSKDPKSNSYKIAMLKKQLSVKQLQRQQSKHQMLSCRNTSSKPVVFKFEET